MPSHSHALHDRVALERRDQVLLVRMVRQEKRNALDQAMTSALDAALNLLDDDPDLRCGILVGGEAFSAGTDLAVGAGEPTERGGPYGVVRRQRRTPLIAAVEGIAYGGGFELVLACDLLIAGRDAQFGLPEVARGVIPTCGGLFRGWRSLPLTVAKQMVLTGRPLTATRAYELGLANELTEPGGAEAAALVLADQICENSPFAVATSLRAMDASLADEDGRGWRETEHALDLVLRSEDYIEGVSAFLDKRGPQWLGR